MDLPSCPACGQSVLDEGVDECPFCGASMSGKPSAKSKSPVASKTAPVSKPAPAASKPGQPAAKPARPVGTKSEPAASASTKPGAPAATGTKSTRPAGFRGPTPTVSDDDPFELERKSQQTKAIQAVPERVKGRSYKVVCPMCDTTGYVPSQAAGRDVQCANPNCMVPVFRAPIVRTEVVKEQQQKSIWSSVALFVGIGLLIVGGAGGGAWWYLFGRTQTEPENSKKTARAIKQPNEKPLGNGGETEQQPETPAAPTSVTLQQIREHVLPMLVKASMDPSGNRSKPLCRRTSAKACAALGDFAEAKNHVDAGLVDVDGRNVPFLFIPPLVDLAWEHLELGHADEAKREIDLASEYAKALPSYGREHIDIATVLAAILVKSGKLTDATALIKAHHDDGELGQLSALVRSEWAFGTCDIDAAISRGSGLPWRSPQIVAVANELAARGFYEHALAWIDKQRDQPEGRAEARAAFARALTNDALKSKRPDNLQRLEEFADKSEATQRARMLAAAAAASAQAGDQEMARKWLERAHKALAEVTPPAPLVLPELNGFFDFQLPKPAAHRMAAYAAADMAAVEMELNQPDAAWASLELALKFLRALSPSLPSIRAQIAEVSTAEGRDAFRNRLKDEFNLVTDDDAYRKLQDYNTACKRIEESATERFALQTQLLMRAVEWNLLEKTWQEVKTRSPNKNLAEADPYLETDLPFALVDAAQKSNATALAKEIESAQAGKSGSPSARQVAEHEFSQALNAGKTAQAAELLAKSPVDDEWRGRRVLQAACRLAKSEKAEVWFSFLMAFNDHRYDVFREEALDLCAVISTMNGHSLEIWDILQKAKLTQTERVALCHGLIIGTVEISPATPAEPAAEEPAQAEAGSL